MPFIKKNKGNNVSNQRQADSEREFLSPYPCSDRENPDCHFTISSRDSSTFTTISAEDEINQKCRNQQQPPLPKMSQDAEGGPEIIVEECALNSHLYTANRPPMNQDEFDRRFRYKAPTNSNGEMFNRGRKLLRHYYKPCKSSNEMLAFITRLVPILNWLPLYSWRQYILNDVIGGLIVGVMHVPQGIAYANLAGVHAVVGLYTSFLPPLFYMLFGTSRHNSIGSFAVVSLMSGMAVNQFLTEYNSEFGDGDDERNLNLTESSDGKLEPFMVSSTLAFSVGLIQILMGILRLELITTYFSDQLVAGFTTGASVHVFVAQLKDVFGISNLPRRTGTGYIFAKLFDIASNINRTNPYTFLLTIASILFLLCGKEILNPLFKHRFHSSVPIPWELILMVMITLFSQIFHFHSNFAIRIVGRIPTGFPSPILPQFSLIPALLPDALGISAVVIAVHISLAKMFAKKMDYRVDPAQELFALGFSSSLSSFFPVYPVSCSLGRTMVNVEAGTKTQLSTLFSGALLAGVILYFGQWLRTLPMCILSAIIIVALKGILKKMTDLPALWPLSKIDFFIWLVSFLSTVCLDVTQGLAISISFALMTTVFRTQWPRWHFLANLTGTNDFRDSERYELVSTYPGICIFRFDSPLLFTNVDNFKETIHRAFLRWNHHQVSNKSKAGEPASSNGIITSDLLSPMEAISDQKYKGKLMIMTESTFQNNGEQIYNNNYQLSNLNKNDDISITDKPTPPKIIVEDSNSKDELSTFSPNFSRAHHIFYRHFIVDCSGFTIVDCMGVNALKEIFTEMRAQRVLIYFAAAKAPVRDLFEKSGFYQFVPKHNFYPTIRDSVAIARKRRNASTQHLLDEQPEMLYDTMEIIQNTQPMN